ncbi:MAG: transporter related protein [Acidimicrobiales bacterium]|nr:transporter related protein [Acidimicrobiales bacterium]
MTDDPVTRLRSVGRCYGSDTPVAALVDLDLTLHARDYVAITGPSGSGKSTLLNIIGLLDRPDEGSHELFGQDVTGLGERARARRRARHLGFVFQSFHLIPHRSACENVELGLLYQGIGARRRTETAEQVLGQCGLGDRLDARPTQLSGGEQQRVAIARALATAPDLLVCDEPTGNLDSRNTRRVLDLFDHLRADGLTIVVATHDPEVSERADRVVHIEDGRDRSRAVAR